MKRYNPSAIEPKWQNQWVQSQYYQAAEPSPNRDTNFYISCMFPYPSGAGMHTGHAFEHAIVDAIARFQRAHGKNVMNPMGWDTFGLPAENYAIKTGTAPADVTLTNIANFKNQLRRMGVSIDWSREINTSDPEYYRWTQWIFTKFFERGLAYQKESLQWWCPVDKTVLANEQVESGKCWRCGTEVVKKSMNQWFFKITEYAEALLEEISALDWPDKIKTAQTNWIGKSRGANIEFAVSATNDTITVFSTRPDTLFGASAVVLAPEHPLVGVLAIGDMRESVERYVSASLKRSEVERMTETKDKTGVFTGSYAINPVTGEKVPIWVADYVLGGYGSGAVMAVPAHDERDYAFAQKFDLPIINVIDKPEDDDSMGVYGGEGILVNSGNFDGMSTSDAREAIVAWLEQNKTGRGTTTYKMRDWLISRQRYWGAPIPIIHCDEHGAVAVPEAQLPVLLPEVEDYAPKGDGKSVLAHQVDWVNTTCPTCGGPARRETDTMDGYACSSWYLLRYTDPKNTEAPWSAERVREWAPVDYYVGGDHAVAHLLYVRFWTHVFKDMGLVDFREPVKKLIYHGYINAEDGTKMSKSKGNVIDPLDIIDQGYGADALRTYLLFMGPIEQDSPWDSQGIAGIYRFLNRVWVLVQEYLEANATPAAGEQDEPLTRAQHKTIRKVTEDMHRQNFNTAIAGLMEYTNDLYKMKQRGFVSPQWKEALGALARLIAPFAPHMAAEIWQEMGHEMTIEEAGWPIWESSLLEESMVTIIVQVNGKLRGKITVAADADPESIKEQAIAEPNAARFIGEKEPAKVIYIPGRLVNIVAK